ncbi:MAG: hypothetical protein WBM50_24065, partial [Acidimicrobiales bacterium]
MDRAILFRYRRQADRRRCDEGSADVDETKGRVTSMGCRVTPMREQDRRCAAWNYVDSGSDRSSCGSR